MLELQSHMPFLFNSDIASSVNYGIGFIFEVVPQKMCTCSPETGTMRIKRGPKNYCLLLKSEHLE